VTKRLVLIVLGAIAVNLFTEWLYDKIKKGNQ